MHDEHNQVQLKDFSPWLNNYDEGVAHTVNIFDEPLYTLLDAAARKHPSRPAVIYQNTSISYAELKDKAEIFASSLRLMGVNHGDRVAIMLPNLPQAIIAFWGVMKAGAVGVMTNPLYMESEIVHHIQDSGANYLIMLDLLWPKIDPLRERLNIQAYIVTGISDALSFPLNHLYNFKTKRGSNQVHVPYNEQDIVTWKSMFSSKIKYCAKNHIKTNDLALLQYTGGTTGLPKGVMLSHANIGTNCYQILTIIKELSQNHHKLVGILPFFHVYGLAVGIIIPTAIMGTALPMPRYVPLDVLNLIKKHKPSIFPGAPSVYISLMQQKNLAKYDLTCINLCISGSAPLPLEHFRKFQELTGATIIEGYGLTEASPITHINPLISNNQKIGSIGMPLPSTKARIVDMEGGSLTLPPGKMGELIIKGPQIMSGYWNKKDETASALRNGWLYTGDLGTMDEEGFFYITDRKKDMVIIGGYNVYPREIDEVLLEHPSILEAVAVGMEDSVRGESLKAFIVLKPGATLTRPEIIAFCKTKLAAYKIPRTVEFREELPKTIVGKVLRRVLRAEDDAKKLTDKNDTPTHTPEQEPEQGSEQGPEQELEQGPEHESKNEHKD